MIRKWHLILAGYRWPREPEPISDQPAGLGFAHRVGRFRSGGSPFSSSVRRFVGVVS